MRNTALRVAACHSGSWYYPAQSGHGIFTEVLGSGATLGDAFVPGMMLTPALALGRWLGNRLHR
mgnify:CR=1 FL=1